MALVMKLTKRMTMEVVVKARCLGCYTVSDFTATQDENGAIQVRVSACDVCVDRAFKDGLSSDRGERVSV